MPGTGAGSQDGAGAWLLGLAVPLRLAQVGRSVPVQLEELGHRA